MKMASELADGNRERSGPRSRVVEFAPLPEPFTDELFPRSHERGPIEAGRFIFSMFRA
jgi:hypothetical protein